MKDFVLSLGFLQSMVQGNLKAPTNLIIRCSKITALKHILIGSHLTLVFKRMINLFSAEAMCFFYLFC